MTDRDRLNVFLYMIAKQCLPFGAIEQSLKVMEGLTDGDAGTQAYANPHMEAYIRSWSARILTDYVAAEKEANRENVQLRIKE